MERDIRRKMMTKLSVNINKIATLRNARGGDLPNVVKSAILCEEFGAEGITVHPRPDGRHITYQDVRDLKKVLTSEFNIEGYPSPSFIDLVTEVVPHQVTLVPDPPDALTSNQGWDTVAHHDFLKTVIQQFKAKGIRTSIFVDTERVHIEGAAKVGTDRVELFTEPYADLFPENPEEAVADFTQAAKWADEFGLEINAGHDLSLENLHFFATNVVPLKEVSIGHALICDALIYGLQNTIQQYLQQLKK